MGELIRTITFGVNIDVDSPLRSARRIHEILTRCPPLLEEHGLQSRCLRVTCQPPHSIYHSADAPARARKLAQLMEEIVAGRAWFCLPGPHYLSPAMPVEAMDAIPAILAGTTNVFTHTLVGSPSGVHRGAIRKTGEIIARLARCSDRNQANFRFTAMANVPPNTPYFPSAYHEGPDGFSIALELAALMNRCFQEEASFDEKLRLFRQEAEEYVARVAEFAEDLELRSNLQFKGIDFSLAPYPGDDSSAVRAVERLSNTCIGSYDFVFPLYAINNLLKQGFAHFPQAGYSGTMLSPLEDSWLARRLREGAFGLKDLLLYACVCGCGLDMVPLPLETSPAQLASLIEPVCAQAIKWNKPLSVRLLPAATSADGMTRFDHDFIVNTKPLPLRDDDFAEHDRHADLNSFFAPATAARGRVDEPLIRRPDLCQLSG